MRRFQELQVLYDTGAAREEVGTLATGAGKTLFEYAASWRSKGMELAPIQMPLAKGAFQFDSGRLVHGVPGLCADSLPDGWGMLIMDRFFARKGVRPELISPLDRLAYLGNDAMGALCYHPASGEGDRAVEAVEIGATAHEAYRLYEGKIEAASALLAKIGGSPGGARPKALIGISDCGTRFVSGSGALPEGYSHWLVKFSGPGRSAERPLGAHEGALELAYIEAARAAGLRLPESRLIADERGLRHIALRRFDRPAGSARLHMASAFGLLHADYRSPTLDYETLMRLAWQLTRDIGEVREQFRRAAFNLFALNRDDHARNHGYLMAEDGSWRLSPAYDLTFSQGPGGEHWTAYLGEGRSPGLRQLMAIARLASLEEPEAKDIVDRVRQALAGLPGRCRELGIPPGYTKGIWERIRQADREALG